MLHTDLPRLINFKENLIPCERMKAAKDVFEKQSLALTISLADLLKFSKTLCNLPPMTHRVLCY